MFTVTIIEGNFFKNTIEKNYLYLGILDPKDT